jgi:hypothetical protein
MLYAWMDPPILDLEATVSDAGTTVDGEAAGRLGS